MGCTHPFSRSRRPTLHSVHGGINTWLTRSYLIQACLPPPSLYICPVDPHTCPGWTPAHPHFSRSRERGVTLLSLSFLLWNLMLHPALTIGCVAGVAIRPTQRVAWASGDKVGSLYQLLSQALR